jgi:hypothetical protein
MRTTLTIDDDLLDQAKRQALDLGISLSEAVCRLLRRGLSADTAQPRQYETITYGDPQASSVDWAAGRATLEADDEQWLRRKAAL